MTMLILAPAVLSFVAAYFSFIIAAALLLRDRRSYVHRLFAIGMILFAGEEILRALSYGVVLPEDVISWQKRVMAWSALIPAVWVAFSLGYGRVDSHTFVGKWKWTLLALTGSSVTFLGIF